MSFTFKKGVHPKDNKDFSKDKKIESVITTKTFFVPITQHLGSAGEVIVSENEQVKCGQLIVKAGKGLSSNIFSPCSGIVKRVIDRLSVTGQKTKHIEIENDYLEDCVSLPILNNPTKEEIVNRIKEAGIVGMGGAGFPTDVKLCPPKDKEIDTLVINAAECEPYITCDYRIMLEKRAEFLEGVRLLKKASGAKQVFIGIEENKLDAILSFGDEKDCVILGVKKIKVSKEDILDENKLKIVKLHTKYPQGAEKQLIYACTKRKVPNGGLPFDVNVTVQNVHTALSVYYAVKHGKPLYERIMTVSGGAVKNPANFWVKTGIPYSVIAEKFGMEETTAKIISGGPMMGFSVHSLDVSVTKTTSSILFLTEKEINTCFPTTCIGCGKCAIVCPMNLMPMFIDANVLVNEYESAKKYGAKDCMECGCCTYICPAKRPLVQSIRVAKKIIRERNI